MDGSYFDLTTYYDSGKIFTMSRLPLSNFKDLIGTNGSNHNEEINIKLKFEEFNIGNTVNGKFTPNMKEIKSLISEFDDLKAILLDLAKKGKD